MRAGSSPAAATNTGKLIMTWLQKLAWEEAFKLLSREPAQLRKMGFKSLEEAVSFELRRVANLAKPVDK